MRHQPGDVHNPRLGLRLAARRRGGALPAPVLRPVGARLHARDVGRARERAHRQDDGRRAVRDAGGPQCAPAPQVAAALRGPDHAHALVWARAGARVARRRRDAERARGDLGLRPHRARARVVPRCDLVDSRQPDAARGVGWLQAAMAVRTSRRHRAAREAAGRLANPGRDRRRQAV
eukprot:7382913-Prymnesium_polylepis.3